MTTISIRNNFPEIAAKLDRLGADVGNKAVVRAINTTMYQGETQMARQISREYRISVGEVKDRLKVTRAIARGDVKLSATLTGSGRRGYNRSMNLIAFVSKARVSKASAKRSGRTDLAGQLQFQIKRAGGKRVIKGAFIGNDGRTVFIREDGAKWRKETKSTLPIRALSTIDVPQMFNTRKINKVVRQVMLDKFPANFQRELRSVLKGFAK